MHSDSAANDPETIGRINSVLDTVIDPFLNQSYIQADLVNHLEVSQGNVDIKCRLNYPADTLMEGYRQLLTSKISTIEGIKNAYIDFSWEAPKHINEKNTGALSQVKNVIAVASGKGGVGKSTVAANLAIALAQEGARIGLLDADIYGPSQGLILGIDEHTRPEVLDNKLFLPIETLNIKTMSMAYLVTEKTPIVWRGPMVSGALLQMMTQTQWGELDYLFVDMPPGTGDIQLTLAQKCPVSAAIIVTTPQDLALLDAQKGVEMFRKVKIPILGIVENMATHVCSHCGHQEAIFGEIGAERLAKDYQTEILGTLPLARTIRKQGDQGLPITAKSPNSELAILYKNTARTLAARLGQRTTNSQIGAIAVQ